MEASQKVRRNRATNFTPDEKILLAQLVKNCPVIESKSTDGKSVAKKQAAWELITTQFNCNSNVHKRDTVNLKRAWDNMKSFTRKARAEERSNIFKTGGGPPPPPQQYEAIISMVEEAAPAIICEINNPFDTDGAALHIGNEHTEGTYLIELTNEDKITATSEIAEVLSVNEIFDLDDQTDEDLVQPEPKTTGKTQQQQQQQQLQQQLQHHQQHQHQHQQPTTRTTDYIRREAVMRIKHLEKKKEVEMKILKTQLEVEQIKKRAALLEEEKNRTLLETAKLELEKLKKSLM